MILKKNIRILILFSFIILSYFLIKFSLNHTFKDESNNFLYFDSLPKNSVFLPDIEFKYFDLIYTINDGNISYDIFKTDLPMVRFIEKFDYDIARTINQQIFSFERSKSSKSLFDTLCKNYKIDKSNSIFYSSSTTVFDDRLIEFIKNEHIFYILIDDIETIENLDIYIKQKFSVLNSLNTYLSKHYSEIEFFIDDVTKSKTTIVSFKGEYSYIATFFNTQVYNFKKIY